MRRTYGMIGLTFIISSLLILTPLHAVTLDVTLGQTRTVSSGEVFTEAFVRNGGVLILDGGTISNGAALTSPSVTVDPGGRFIFNSGSIHYFENWGITELYGGIQSTYTSENRGYLKYAGGNPSYSNEYGQLSLFDGTVDIYSTASNRLLWYIEAMAKFDCSGASQRCCCLRINICWGGSNAETPLPAVFAPACNRYRSFCRVFAWCIMCPLPRYRSDHHELDAGDFLYHAGYLVFQSSCWP